ncbi:CFEM domain-containing protein [Colletotrichum kahawae]|uniref:CFEM domain-containing protein n=1 Tax=Colletotrichum kahawae TaxID=34407 RepID=A0AAD9YLN1_COLKA|nr:CFEM domain-containing protein [Colletotrichum kahawae]
MKIFYAFANVYTLAIAALKATILFFYQRVFGGFSSLFTTILWCTQAFNLLTFIGFTIPTIAQCQPLSFAWEGWDGRHEGFCLNILSMIVTHAAVNIGLDIWMLVLPSTQVLRLNLRWREKAEILAMFGIGIFITAVSIIRLTVLLNLRNFENPTQDAFYLHLWSYIEISVGVIIASLPAMRQLLRHCLPKSFPAMRNESPNNMAQARPGDSTRRLRNTPVTGLSVDQAIPTSVEGFAASSHHRDDARQIMSSL